MNWLYYFVGLEIDVLFGIAFNKFSCRSLDEWTTKG
jgi:hypothetical protein